MIMTMTAKDLRRAPHCLLIAAGSLVLAGCGGGSGGVSSGGGGGMVGPAAFNEVVKSTLMDAESAEPRDVNDQDFEFTDEPEAFDDVLATAFDEVP